VSSFEWSADGSCLYYCAPDELGRPSKVRATCSRTARLLTYVVSCRAVLPLATCHEQLAYQVAVLVIE
jgi:hypothetical protein